MFSLWEDFLGAFWDCFFHQKLREVKDEELANLKQGKINMKEYG